MTGGGKGAVGTVSPKHGRPDPSAVVDNGLGVVFSGGEVQQFIYTTRGPKTTTEGPEFPPPGS